MESYDEKMSRAGNNPPPYPGYPTGPPTGPPPPGPPPSQMGGVIVNQPGFIVGSPGVVVTSPGMAVGSPIGVPVMIGQQMGSQPGPFVCKSCSAEIVTRVVHRPTVRTHMFALLLCLLGCWPCVFVPYCMDSCQSADHYCPNCSAYIGSYIN